MRGKRLLCNLYEYKDYYIENKEEIEKVIKPFECVSNSISISEQVFLSSCVDIPEDNCIYLHKLLPGDKIFCTVEEDLYIYEKELNKLGVETRIARNIEDNVLSLAILSVPEIKEE